MHNNHPENKNLIHKKLYQLRRERGMSQQALAEELRKLGIPMSRQTISKIERNVRYALDYEVLGICLVFLVHPSELMREELEQLID